MNFKRLLFISSTLLAIPFFASAQKSASATMQVQVTVLEGNSISQNGLSNVNLSQSKTASGYSELTTIVLSNSNEAAFVIDRPETLNLADGNGRNLLVPIDYSDSINGKDMTTSVNARSLETTEEMKGTYSGSYTTSVAYL